MRPPFFKSLQAYYEALTRACLGESNMAPVVWAGLSIGLSNGTLNSNDWGIE